MSKNLEAMEFEALDKDVFIDVDLTKDGEIIDVVRNKKGEIIGIIRNTQGDIIKVESSFTNFRIMCHHYKITLSYDIISKEIVSNLDVKSQNSMITMIQSLMILNGMDHRMAAKYIDFLVEENPMGNLKTEN